MEKSPDRLRDELIVLRCQDGDAEALAQLVLRWQASFRRHAWYLTQDSESARDVVQDAWVDIVRNIRRLREPASFRAWAFRIVSNKAADLIRQRDRQRSLAKEVTEQKQSSNHCGATGQRDVDAQSLVTQCIQSLPVNCQQILSMKYMDHMSTSEIAEALGIPVGTVKSRLHFARGKLKDVIERRTK